MTVLHAPALSAAELDQFHQQGRAFSVCYIDAATRQKTTGHAFPRVFPTYQPISGN